MRSLLVTACLLSFAPVLSAQEAGDRAAIEAVIADQLADFTARDIAGAWDHASRAIRGIFGTPERFGAMVQGGYPMVWDNRNARFLDLREEGGRLRQRVAVTGPDGRDWVLDYEMIEQEDGWKINGVWILPPMEGMV
ncbi:hypothetical protein ruthe_01148 [Rubellimicrobium thermophilum DSM 16684]|uniref:DUF4864 domain-containing protein n=1 Tax=Rubellimicrobium thermophilum DSM 16684 TaxID=1123069 RepID=S9R2X6_9RHOB|nr:DUF4864 domain-containing protein [Rubellimicrobium thermophilum]EPX86333.1 hypothetical protein ruthe_01148 [Rubellimicrobium thermophilum DSM 16684]